MIYRHTTHYHNVKSLHSIHDRFQRTVKKDDRNKNYMFHDVPGYDLITIFFCWEREEWVLEGHEWDKYEPVDLKRIN